MRRLVGLWQDSMNEQLAVDLMETSVAATAALQEGETSAHEVNLVQMERPVKRLRRSAVKRTCPGLSVNVSAAVAAIDSQASGAFTIACNSLATDDTECSSCDARPSQKRPRLEENVDARPSQKRARLEENVAPTTLDRVGTTTTSIDSATRCDIEQK